MRGEALVVDDDPQMLVAMEAALARTGLPVTTAASGEEAIERLQDKTFSIIFTDLRMPRMDGIELLRQIKTLTVNVPIVLMTAHGSIDNAVQAMKLGAVEYLQKPFDAAAVESLTNRLVPRQRDPDGGFITVSPGVEQMLNVARRAAQSSVTVLVEGESGTGKEVLARLIHRSSPRRRKAFVAVNCAAIPEQLLESELFGHERGAFTGANVRREGKFELASGGTLLLDEIGEMPLPLQTKLLRVLQEKTVDRVGGREPVPVDLRVVATTNIDLSQAVRSGDFRRDLFFRLRVVRLHLPSLRQRPEDIPRLATHFCQSMEGGARTLTDDAIEKLAGHEWPGNVRELKNVLECAATLTASAEIHAADLSLDPPDPRDIPSRDSDDTTSGDSRTIAQMEQRLILGTLSSTHGNRTLAAEQLGISIRTLRNKIHQYRAEGVQVVPPTGRPPQSADSTTYPGGNG